MAAVSLATMQGCARRAASEDKRASETVVAESHRHDHAADALTDGEHRHEGGCAASADSHTHAHDDGHGHDHPADTAEAQHAPQEDDPDEIVFPAAQAARTDFEVSFVKRGPFRETLRCGGEIYASQSELSVVSAPIAGVVTFVDGLMPNSSVKAGQGMFRLSSGGLASGDAVQKARIAFNQAEADFQRIKALYEDKLVTQRDYLAAEAEYLRTKAEYDPVRVSDGSGTLIQAPASGYVLQMSVAPGDYVEMGQPLATIAKSGRMQLQAMVSQRYFDRLPYITDATFRTPASSDYFLVSRLGGRLYTSGKVVSPGSSLVPVVFEFDSDGGFPDGAYADVVLLGRQREDVVSIPLSALTEQQGLYYVYVQLDEDCYRRQQVWPGSDDGICVEILRGLQGGERIVTRGAINVKMASASEAIPHGHTH